MSFPTLRRSLWVPGVVLAAAALGIATLLGLAPGSATGPAALATLLMVLAGLRWGGSLWKREPPPPPVRGRGRMRAVKGGKADSPAEYDLANDRSTDNQRYLM